MTVLLAVSAAALLVATAVTVHRLPRIHPASAAVALVIAVAASALVGLWLVSIPAIGFLAHSSADGGLAGWCRSLVAHRDVPPWLGLPALGFLIYLLGRGTVTWRRMIRQGRRLPRGDRFTILPSPAPIAVTTPGRHGRVIVSTGLLDQLEPIERRAVLAHERAHLDCRHDRFLLLTEVAVAMLPPLTPMRRLVRGALERWADERAASELGDRGAVGRAIANAALVTQSAPGFGLAMAETDVLNRVEAMSREAPGAFSTVPSGLVFMSGGLVLAVASEGVLVQLHYLGELITRVCPF